jgi:mono/diheme cytochrome c family protein/cytochrome c553
MHRLSQGTIVITLLAMALLAASCAQTQERTRALIERGDYLVNGIMTCNHCHTPKDKAGNSLLERRFAGGSQRFDELTFSATGSNITQDTETGIGNWRDADIRRALTEGVRPNGVKLAFVMPYALYQVITPRDLNAVVAYLRTVAPIRATVTPPLYKWEQMTYTYPGAEKQMTENDLRDPVKRGLYLASLGHCMQCHAERHNDIPDYRGGAGKGGREFKTPAGLVVRASNITSHPRKGLGAWSDDEIKRALTAGISRDGRPLAQTMAQYRVYHSRLTDEDLNALVAWLRTLPPLE